MQFSLITPEKTIKKEEEVKRVTIPTSEGEITVLPGHLPIVTFLKPGELIVEDNDGTHSLSVSGGFIEVTQNTTKVLADTAETIEEIDMKRAEEAKERAQKLLKEKKFDAKEFAYLSAKIEKELARLKVGKKYRRLRPPRE